MKRPQKWMEVVETFGVDQFQAVCDRINLFGRRWYYIEPIRHGWRFTLAKRQAKLKQQELL